MFASFLRYTKRNAILILALIVFLALALTLVFSYQRLSKLTSQVLATQEEMNYWPMSQVEVTAMEYLTYRALFMTKQENSDHERERLTDAYANAWASVSQILRSQELNTQIARVSGALYDYEAIRSTLELSEPFLRRIERGDSKGLEPQQREAFDKISDELLGLVRKISSYPLASARAQVQDLRAIKLSLSQAQQELNRVFLGAAITAVLLLLLVFIQVRRIEKSGKHLEQALDAAQQSKQLLEKLSEASFEGTAILQDQKIISCNQRLADMLGLSPLEIIGLPAQKILAPQCPWPQIVHAPTKQSEAQIQDVTALRADGTIFSAQISVRTLASAEFASAQGEQVLALRDITAQKQHEQELEAAKEQAEQGARSKAAFLATMSHEIRTPMNGLIGMAELLRSSPLAPQEQHYAKTLYHSASSLLVILNDILDFSKLEEGKVRLEKLGFLLPPLLDEICQLMTPQAEKKGLKLELDIDPRIQKPIITDPARLRQILLNMVGNAIKFTHKGHVKISVKLEKSAQEEQSAQEPRTFLNISVEDTGIGIQQEQLALLFDAFAQAETGISRQFGGTGLGLAICKRLVELMGGKIAVQSVHGQGSKFWFTLPFITTQNPDIDAAQLALSSDQQWAENSFTMHAPKLEDAERNNDTTQRDPQSNSLQTAPLKDDCLHILLAEDSQINREVVFAMLNDQDLSIDVAVDGAQALTMAQQQNYDLILMDLSMPNMDGLEATRQIRALDHPNAETPIIAMTANASMNDRDNCLNVGMDDFVSKPFSKAQLLEVISVWRSHSQNSFDTDEQKQDTGQNWQQDKSDEQEAQDYLFNQDQDFSSDDEDLSEIIKQAEQSPLVNQESLNSLIDDIGKDTVKGLIEGFWEQMDSHIIALDQALQQKDHQQACEELRHVAHTIKGAALTYGAQRFGMLAKCTEKLADDGQLDQAQLFAQHVKDTLEPSKQALSETLS